MQISVTFRHIDSSDALSDYATEKIGKLAAKYLKNTESAHAILSVNKHRHQAEINIHASHFDISAHEVTDDLYSAIDLTLNKLERQLRKHNDRLNHHKGRNSVARKSFPVHVDVFDAEGLKGSDAARKVIETDAIPAKPLTVDDAILQLELSNNEFLVFHDAERDRISVIYKRRDGNYGLIAPNT